MIFSCTRCHPSVKGCIGEWLDLHSIQFNFRTPSPRPCAPRPSPQPAVPLRPYRQVSLFSRGSTCQRRGLHSLSSGTLLPPTPCVRTEVSAAAARLLPSLAVFRDLRNRITPPSTAGKHRVEVYLRFRCLFCYCILGVQWYASLVVLQTISQKAIPQDFIFHCNE
jgi:hypothetical protein